MENLMLSCDWGTTSFRLRLVQVPDLNIVGEVVSGDGVLSTYNQWQKSCRQQEVSREHFYATQLQVSIEKLSAGISADLSSTPIIISGMASSSIGIKEIPYASLPFSLDGKNALVHRLSAAAGLPAEVWLISGVKNKTDVMRGEETQVIGLSSVNERLRKEKEVICILPGTHSKHVMISNGELVDFQTFMTGELFQLMAQHSILKDSVCESDNEIVHEIYHDAFCHGITESGQAHLLQTLFSVRTNGLFGFLNREENFFYLSGLLIGAELRTLVGKPKVPLVLCSGSRMYRFYELALRELGLIDQTELISPEVMDKAATAGQVKVFENYAG